MYIELNSSIIPLMNKIISGFRGSGVYMREVRFLVKCFNKGAIQ